MARLVFEKVGRAVWISHLDLMRLFQRAFKRAELPLKHTQGYNPRPSVSIALPLSVGVESVCELLDYELVEGNATVEQLNEKLPAGVRVAHKTGSIDHLANDCGIVYTDCGNYVLTLFYNGNLASEEEYEGSEWTAVGNRLLSGLSAEVYRIFTEHYRK